MPTVLVDTNIWLHGLTRPRDPAYTDLHRAAEAFLDAVLRDPATRVAVSAYHIAEILEILRKSGLAEAERAKLAVKFKTGKFLIREITSDIVFECLDRSSRSGIHVYDYLVALPLRGQIDRIFSGDDHFLHPDFTSIAPVENPVAPWRLREGQKPARN